VSSRDWNLRVQDILVAIHAIQRYTAGKTFVDFREDEVVIQAVLYNFVIIGEATRNIPSSIQLLAPNIPWRFMSNMRNVVAHEYFQVDLQRVWKTIQTDLPPLVPQLQELLNRPTQNE
jgi:uncharacterized protein with HEPN domain